MSETFLLAIDNGSQSTKVSVIDEMGTVQASAQHPLRPYDTSVPGHVVHPDDDVWDSIRRACNDALARFDGELSQIVAVGLCTIRFCRALLDGDGRLVEPLMSWMDDRVSRPHDPGDLRVAWVTTSSGYITHRLTGRFVDTRANYQGVWPIDKVTADWSADPAAYDATGMPRDRLFELVSPGELLGIVTGDAARLTGIPAGLPVFATANDKAVEALGCGLRDQRTILISLGTYIAGMTLGTDPQPADDAYWVNFAARPGHYLYESHGIRRGMWTVSWLRDLVSGAGFGEPVETSAIEAALNAEGARVAPGAGGLMAILDWLAPTDAGFRRGALLGFDGTQGRAHLYRAVLEGIAMTMREHVDNMESALGGAFDSVMVSGGGSGSDLMLQIVADVFERPASRAAMPDAAGLGAAVCAAVGAGVHESWEAALDAMVGHGREFVPDASAVTAYAEIRPRYARLRQFTDPLFRLLGE